MFIIKYCLHQLIMRNTVPMRVVEEGGVEGRATVAAYDWLDGWGGTSSGLSSSICSTCSSLESNSLREQSRQRVNDCQLAVIKPAGSIVTF